MKKSLFAVYEQTGAPKIISAETMSEAMKRAPGLPVKVFKIPDYLTPVFGRYAITTI